MKLLNENVCTFIQHHPSNDLHIFHVVYETKTQYFDGWKTLSFYRIHFVTNGEGILHTQNGEYHLSAGDIFFCLPSTPYGLQSIKDFRYAYVGYLGERANATAHNFSISVKNCVFHGLEKLSALWLEMIEFPDEICHLAAEGVLLYSLSALAARLPQFKNEKHTPSAAALIKKRIDEDFSNPNLSLQSLCLSLSYNPKYISKVFKATYRISFKEYLNTIRINNACALISKGFSSVKEIAFLCGFNDPLYFSKVFKQRTLQSPSEYVSTVRFDK